MGPISQPISQSHQMPSYIIILMVYCSAIWRPYLIKDIENFQRLATALYRQVHF